MTRANGVSTTYSFDQVGRLLSLVHAKGASVLSSVQYIIDAAGQRTSQQLRTGQTLMTQPAISTVDNGDRLVARAADAYSYDDGGNLILHSSASGNSTYIWDSRGRLKSVRRGGGMTDFVYDYEGNMLRMINNLITTTYVLDAITNVAFESTTGGDQFSILTGAVIDSHQAALRGIDGVEYLLTDGLNSTVATSDRAGALKDVASYDPFGKATTTGAIPFQFTGHIPIDDDLYYYRDRFLSSGLGRFISEDRFLPIGSGTLFRYANNSPTNFIDPLGLVSWPTDFAVVTSSFGAVDPVRNNQPHNGVDFRNRDGQPVFATDTGQVTLTNTENGGSQILLQALDGGVAGYAHTTPLVTDGQYVFEGQQIGQTDQSGHGTGPHLHYTYRPCPNCPRIDPLQHLNGHITGGYCSESFVFTPRLP